MVKCVFLSGLMSFINISAVFNVTFCGENMVFVDDYFFSQKCSHMLQVSIIICSDMGLGLFHVQFSIFVCHKKQ
jgi:hypothetical protein